MPSCRVPPPPPPEAVIVENTLSVPLVPLPNTEVAPAPLPPTVTVIALPAVTAKLAAVLIPPPAPPPAWLHPPPPPPPTTRYSTVGVGLPGQTPPALACA